MIIRIHGEKRCPKYLYIEAGIALKGEKAKVTGIDQQDKDRWGDMVLKEQEKEWKQEKPINRI